MPQKQKRQAARRSSPTASNKTPTNSIVIRASRKRTTFTRRGEELQSRSVTRSEYTRSNLLRVASDMRRAALRGETLTFTQAAHNRGVSPSSRQNHLKNLFYKDASGRIYPRNSDNYTQEFTLPTTRTDRFDSVTARGNVERALVGRWLNAIQAARSGDFSLIRDFPKGEIVDGKRIPTSPYEVQKILEALEQSETPLEQQYYGGAR